jgi:ABC-type Fe3+ transport system substrate-binding protein
MTDVREPAIPAVADLLPPKWRSLIYLVSVMLAPAFAVIEANADLHYGWLAGYAAWNGLVGLLAVSNTPMARRADRGSLTLGDILMVVVIVLAILFIVDLVRR